MLFEKSMRKNVIVSTTKGRPVWIRSNGLVSINSLSNRFEEQQKAEQLTKIQVTNNKNNIMLQNHPPCLLAILFILLNVPPRNAEVFSNASPNTPRSLVDSLTSVPMFNVISFNMDTRAVRPSRRESFCSSRSSAVRVAV